MVILKKGKKGTRVPKVVDHDERREHIAAAAADAIAELGIEATKMTDVAERAGCTTGMVTYYFDDKDAVLLAGLEHVSQAMRSRVRQRLAADPADLRGALAELLPLDAARRRENRVWVSFWGRAAFADHLAREHRRLHDAEGIAMVSATIDEAQSQGTVSSALDATEEAHALLAFVDGVSTAAVFSPRRWSSSKQIQQLDRYLERLR